MRTEQMLSATVASSELPVDSLIAAHGGALKEQLAPEELQSALVQEAMRLPRVPIDRWTLADLELFSGGALSPLEGFMTHRNYDSVLADMRLANSVVWPLPITFARTEAPSDSIRRSGRATLTWDGNPQAILEVEDIWRRDGEYEAQQAFGTTDTRHPGVARLLEQGTWLIGGRVTVLKLLENLPFASLRLRPRETRRLFAERGWRSIVGFQTRNPVHRAHEYLQKVALEQVDGLLLHPIGGETKGDDISLAVRMRCYEVLLKHYYPASRVLLALNPASMRYAGPREAIFHALLRKNFGCTHFIIGRDHAGVGNFYDPYAAHRLFQSFDPSEIGIQPLFFENAFYCRRCAGMATIKTCPHTETERLALSGTAVRDLLSRKEPLPAEFSRPEVAAALCESTSALCTLKTTE